MDQKGNRFGCGADWIGSIQKNWVSTNCEQGELIAVMWDNLWGFCDRQGGFVFLCQYSAVHCFAYGWRGFAVPPTPLNFSISMCGAKPLSLLLFLKQGFDLIFSCICRIPTLYIFKPILTFRIGYVFHLSFPAPFEYVKDAPFLKYLLLTFFIFSAEIALAQCSNSQIEVAVTIVPDQFPTKPLGSCVMATIPCSAQASMLRAIRFAWIQAPLAVHDFYSYGDGICCSFGTVPIL